MASGKGKKCPNCGHATFQTNGKIYQCSHCGARGWSKNAPPKPGGGKGQFCHICEAQTLHELRNFRSGVTVFLCKGCELTVITVP